MIRDPTPFVLPNLQIPGWPYENSLVAPPSPSSFPVPNNTDDGAADSSLLLHPFLSNDCTLPELHSLAQDLELPVDAFSNDNFRMFEFKIRMCPRGGRSHDWTRCPFAHSGEKARRRDLRKFPYSDTPCPDFRHANCKKGDSCEFAHGVFECWLHPSRYRTQFCKDATRCRRRVCFFAHSPDQLRVLTPGSVEASVGSPICRSLDSSRSSSSFISSPTAVLTSPLPDSSALSPGFYQLGGNTYNAMLEILTSMRNVQHNSNRIISGFCCPRGSIPRPGISSLQSSTPAWATADESGPGSANFCDSIHEVDSPMERVESGRDLGAKIYAKLSNETSCEQSDAPLSAPDFGWVSELVK